jgi:hypothetical protein
MPEHISNLAMPAAHHGTEARVERSKAEPKLAYTIRHFCEAVGIGPTKTYSEIKAGRLKTAWVAGRRLILHEDAEAWLRAGREEGKDARP